jgi:NADPH2:quinone reductase
MKAAFYERLGAARDVLFVSDLPDPEPGPGEVRVRIDWSGVNPSDVKSRLGARSPLMPFPRIVPHSDGAGTIDAVGAGISSDRVGEQVWTWNAAWGRSHGTACEAVCLPSQQAVRLPDAVTTEAGACLGIPALTALHAVLLDGGVAGKTVLVAGGAGAVGHYAVQMASRLGARQVIATVSSKEKAEIALAAGADAVILYRDEPLVERARELANGRGIDRVIEVDMAANGAANAELLSPQGECVAYGSSGAVTVPFFPLIAKNLQLKFFIVYHLTPADRARATDTLQRMLSRNELNHMIAARFTLADIVAAHELVESGQAIGNVVVTPR